MSHQLKIHRVTSLPSQLEAYSIYLVAPPSKPDYVEMYVSDSTGARAKRIIREEDIDALITNKIQETVKPISEIKVVDNNEALQALNDDQSTVFVYVKDATQVPGAEVERGGATFIRDGSTWVKVAEAESLDVALNWSAIQGRPNVNATDIEDAVTKRHQHANLTQLNKIGEEGGELTYGGRPVSTAWTTTDW